jgi:hypothetical protein
MENEQKKIKGGIMGELAGNFWDSPEGTIAKDNQAVTKPPEGKMAVDGHEGIFCDGVNQRDKLPIFKVPKDEFYQNMSHGRQRMRFGASSDVSKYMKSTGYKGSFWIQDDKEGYVRKIK